MYNCIILCPSFNPANLKSHMKNKHPDEDYSAVKNPNPNSLKRKMEFVKGGGTLCSVGSFTVFEKSADPRSIKINGDRLLYTFLTQCNVPARHSNSPYLLEYLKHVVSHPVHYARKDTLGLSRNRYADVRTMNFANFIKIVTTIIERTRQYYMTMTNSPTTIPFVNVAHDGWDSKDDDVLGVSIHLVDPLSGEMFSVAIGLQRLSSKKAVDVASDILRILAR